MVQHASTTLPTTGAGALGLRPISHPTGEDCHRCTQQGELFSRVGIDPTTHRRTR